MKRCPECRRDYYDDTLLYCLDDGNALLEGPASGGGPEPPVSTSGQFGEEPQTAILHPADTVGEAPTRAQFHATDQTAILHRGVGAEPSKHKWAAIAVTSPARFLGRENEFGNIEKGYAANLVLLDADPLENIRNVRRVNSVILRGRIFDRGALDRLLADVEKLASNAGQK